MTTIMQRNYIGEAVLHSFDPEVQSQIEGDRAVHRLAKIIDVQHKRAIVSCKRDALTKR